MSTRKSVLRVSGLVISVFALVFLMACANELKDPVDPEEQLEEDIAIIEDYLADKGYTDYDTLDSEVRVVILEEGDGDLIEYEDIVQYDYIGMFTSDIMFDTSIGSLALEQDLEHAVDTVYLKKEDSEMDSLDADGEKIIDEIIYEEDYTPIYSSSRTYQPLVTTHTKGGWFIQLDQSIQGFKDGTHEVLDNTNVGGKGLILIPSRQAYGTSGSGLIEPNTVLLFEIRPVNTR